MNWPLGFQKQENLKIYNMSLVKFNHRPTFNSLFDDFFANTESLDKDYSKYSVPAVNVKEGEKQFTIEVAVPGVKKEDINIELENDKLTISSEVEKETNDSTDKFTRREFMYSKFQRTFNLPKDIDQKGIKGDYNNGILSITIPKQKEVNTTKRITIA